MIPRRPGLIWMVGTFPPPMHGMAAVNAAVRDALQSAGSALRVLDVAAPSLRRGALARLERLPRAVRAMVSLIVKGRRGDKFYISASGGWGQIYDISFLIIARFRRMRVFAHHHSFAYLDEFRLRTKVLVSIAGRNAVHVTQSPNMAKRLVRLYGANLVVPMSNAVFLLDDAGVSIDREALGTLGFIGNIAREKGIFLFLELCASIQKQGLDVRARIAGPFQDDVTERAVRAELEYLPGVQYIGPVYGEEKKRFFSDIDALVFPTIYDNETEGIVNLEAMRHACPVIAYGRGCIPEIISGESGRVIDPREEFVISALGQVNVWLDDAVSFRAASRSARERFVEIYTQSSNSWRSLLKSLKS